MTNPAQILGEPFYGSEDKGPSMENKITSFTASELLDAQAIGILADQGKLDDHTAAEYEDALERAALLYSDTYAEANPSAAAAERRRLERRIEIKRSRP